MAASGSVGHYQGSSCSGLDKCSCNRYQSFDCCGENDCKSQRHICIKFCSSLDLGFTKNYSTCEKQGTFFLFFSIVVYFGNLCGL